MTSIVTTLVTLGATLGVGKLRGASERRKRPLQIRRSYGRTWNLVNRSKRSLVDINVNVNDQDGDWRQLEDVGQIPLLEPSAEYPLGELFPEETLSIYWSELRRNRRHGHHSASLRIKADQDEQHLIVDSSYGGNGGGGK